MKKNDKNFLSTVLILTILYVVFNQINYGLPFIETLMNSFFWLGFTFMLVGSYALVDILGLFKSFSYLFYKRKMKAENKTRIKEGEEPQPILDLYDFMQTKEHVTTRTLIKIFITSFIFYGVSYLISLRYI